MKNPKTIYQQINRCYPLISFLVIRERVYIV
jgi:hypothetical protein